MSISESPIAVRRYARDGGLQPPERTVLEVFAADLPGWDVLDIGVGAGRTTAHLAGRARSYRAVDYSESMVAACRGRFPELADRISVMDVCDLSALGDDAFDFVLFSFNGLDYLPSYDARQLALREIRRVTRPGGVFTFSSHNLDNPDLFSFRAKAATGLRQKVEHVVKHGYRLLANTGYLEARGRPWARLRDGGHLFTLTNFYVKPGEQRLELERHGFTDVRLYGLADGRELASDRGIEDPWVYYSCRVRK